MPRYPNLDTRYPVCLVFLLLLAAMETGCLAQPSVAAEAFAIQIPPRALDYQRSHYLLLAVGIVWNLLGLFLLLQTGIAARLRTRLYRALKRTPPAEEKAMPPPFRAILLYYAAYLLWTLLWSLPLGLIALRVEQRFGFARETVFSYLRDVALSSVFRLTSVPLLLAGYWLYYRAGRNWWKWLWALCVPLLLFQIILQPILIAPRFNTYTPLAASPLRDKILTLAAASGITDGRVYVEDTSRRTRHVNAYVTGVGPTTRIVINDTALQILPEDQILAMVGHEMGHYVEGHLWWNWISGSLGAGLFLWLLSLALPRLQRRFARSGHLHGLNDLAALPLILLTLNLFLLAQEPLASWESRVIEHRADAFGLRVTHLNEATARLMKGFAERDFADPDPPAWYYLWFSTHPKLVDRIAFALQYRP